MEIERIDSEYENLSKQILEPPAPEIISLVSEEIEDRVSSEFTKSDEMDIFPSLPMMTFVHIFISVTTLTPPVSKSGDLSILDLLRHFETAHLQYSLVTTPTSNHYHFGIFMHSLIGNASKTPLSSHTRVYTISEPRVRVTPLTTMSETCVPFTFISTISVSAPQTTLCQISGSFSTLVSVP